MVSLLAVFHCGQMELPIKSRKNLHGTQTFPQSNEPVCLHTADGNGNLPIIL